LGIFGCAETAVPPRVCGEAFFFGSGECETNRAPAGVRQRDPQAIVELFDQGGALGRWLRNGRHGDAGGWT